ncbi:MAG: hypothetical protein ACRDNT_08465 [Streptosporangiaceae bacterium]
MSGQGRYGSGPGSDPHEALGGRRDVPFGPEISWPYGFRQLDSESREVLESAYGAGPRPVYQQPAPGYQQPAMDDYGYGDPGYSDPSYEGPRTPYAGAAFGGQPDVGQPSAPRNDAPRNATAPRPSGGSGYWPPDTEVPGYHVPETRESARPGYASPGYQPQDAPPSGGQGIWPVTGAQEALPDTGPQPVAGAWGARGTGGFPQTGNATYPEQWYDNPCLDDRVLDGPPAASRSVDPRLEGMNYGELRYDEPDPRTPGEPGYDEPLDDESWYQELRRSAPAYPQRSGPQGGPSGSQRRVEPQVEAPLPGHGQPGYPQAPDRAAGYGQPRGDWGGSDPKTPQSSHSQSPQSPYSQSPYSQSPQMSAGRMTGAGPRAGGQPGPSFPPGPGAQGTGFLSAPTGQVGLLTPPSGTRVDALRDDGVLPAAPSGPGPRAGTAASQVLTTPGASRPRTATVRPGHGLDGPEITSSWPTQPDVDDPDSFEDFWRDDEDEEYTGLFGDRHAEFDRADARQAAASRQVAAKRGIGRRRGRSNDHRLWLGLGGVVIVAAAAITGIIKFEFPSHGGPAHTMAIPPKIGTYARTVDLERQADVSKLRSEVIQMSSGQASGVVSAVYESGDSAAGNTEQIIMFIGGHLANADPAASITSFTQKYPGAHVVTVGSLGGEAACVQEGTASASNSVSMCAWFDNDSFGEIVSPTMNATALANAMRTIRPSVEHLAAK